MQLIAVDIGNSSTKIGVLRNSVSTVEGDQVGPNKTTGRHWSGQVRLQNENPIVLDSKEFKLPDEPALWAVSSVNSVRAKELEAWISDHRADDRFHLIQESEVDLNSDVQSRKQLGRDRLIAAWMAVELNQGVGPVVVVDIGTAVTIELVDDQLVFQGGYIFPGADSNFQQLVQNTDALPALSQEQRSELLKNLSFGSVGKSTDEAIFNGVYQSQIGGIVGIVAAISEKLPSQPAVYLTGGGAQDISKLLPQSWQRVPDLVLRGAGEIGRRLI